MTDDSDEWGYQRKCIDTLKMLVDADEDWWGNQFFAKPVEESYPKPEAPKILSSLEEQDRVWKLLVQAAKN